jgi:hypothetical protein
MSVGQEILWSFSRRFFAIACEEQIVPDIRHGRQRFPETGLAWILRTQGLAKDAPMLLLYGNAVFSGPSFQVEDQIIIQISDQQLCHGETLRYQ